MDKFHQLMSIRLAALLAHFYQYDIAKIEPETGHIELHYPTHNQYPTIHIRLNSLDEVDDLSAQMVETMNRMNSKKRDLKLLTFTFVDESKVTPTHRIEKVQAGNLFSSEILTTFPKLKQLNWESSDFDAEMKKAVAQLNQATHKHRQQRIKKATFGNSKGAITIVAIAVLIHMLGIFVTSIAKYEATYMILLGGLYVPFIQGAYEVGRFITAGFVHASLTHLFVNMMSLYNVSVLLEKAYGTKKFLITLLVSIIGGNLVVYIADTKAVISVGMSTGIYGLLGLLVVYLFDTGLIKSPLFRRQLMLIASVNLIINFLPNISWLGHLGGFVSGVIVGVILTRKPQWKALRLNTIIASLILVVLMSVMAINRPKPAQQFILNDIDTIDVARKLNLEVYADYLETNLFKYYQVNKGEILQ